MLQTVNKYALIVSAITLLISFWNRNAIPRNLDFDPRLADEPRQKPIERPPFAVNYDGVDYRVEPLYDYELYGLVVSYRQHNGRSLMHRLSNDHLNMADLCVVWSDTAFSDQLDKLDFWNGVFTCNVKTRDAVAWSQFRPNQLSNNHLISADPFIRRSIGEVAIGDQIRIRGRLAHYGAIDGINDIDGIEQASNTAGAIDLTPANAQVGNRDPRTGRGRASVGHASIMRGTSATRDDTGDGACETIFVDEFEIVEPAFSRWRATLYLSLTVLLATIAVHFALPYRPYRD